jgi:hypothetical protein
MSSRSGFDRCGQAGMARGQGTSRQRMLSIALDNGKWLRRRPCDHHHGPRHLQDPRRTPSHKKLCGTWNANGCKPTARLQEGRWSRDTAKSKRPRPAKAVLPPTSRICGDGSFGFERFQKFPNLSKPWSQSFERLRKVSNRPAGGFKRFQIHSNSCRIVYNGLVTQSYTHGYSCLRGL